MTLYLIDGRGYFDAGAGQIANGFVRLNLMPKASCPATINGKAFAFENGVAEIPAEEIREGINAITVCGNKCEMLIRNGDNLTPMGFSARDLVKVAFDVSQLARKVETLEKWETEQTVDLFV